MASALTLALQLFLTQFSTWAASLIDVKHPLRNFCSLLAVALNLACLFAYDNSSDEVIEKRNTRAVVATTLAGSVYTSFERLVCSKWNLDAGGPDRYRQRRTQPSKSLSRYTLDLLSNPRAIGQPWQAKGVPPFSSLDPKYVPSRAKFLAMHFASFVCCVLVLDLCAYALPPSTELYSKEAIPVFGCISGLSTNLTMFRLTSTIFFWLRLALSLIIAVDAAASVAVACGLSNPQDWPPLLGSPRELYTIRKFWG